MVQSARIKHSVGVWDGTVNHHRIYIHGWEVKYTRLDGLELAKSPNNSGKQLLKPNNVFAKDNVGWMYL